jgi:hypothetical protein
MRINRIPDRDLHLAWCLYCTLSGANAALNSHICAPALLLLTAEIKTSGVRLHNIHTKCSENSANFSEYVHKAWCHCWYDFF